MIKRLEENTKWIILSLIGGILMTFGSISGTLALHFIVVEFTLKIFSSKVIEEYIVLFLIICAFLANTGGIAVIIGTLFIAFHRMRIGKIISALGTGLGLVGLILLATIQIISGGIFGIFSEIIIGLSSVSGVLGSIGFIIVIISRKKIIRIETPIKIDIKKVVAREHISKVITVIISLFFFVYFEIILISVFDRLLFLPFYNFLFWQIASICLQIALILFNLFFKYFRLLFLSIVSFSVGSAWLFVLQLHKLIFPKVILGIIFILSLIASGIHIKYIKHQPKSSNRAEAGHLILVFIFITFICALFLTIPKQKVIIEPKTSPELIFFVSPYQLPNNNETYEDWGDNRISFMPSVGIHTWNKSSLMDRYKLAIKNGVNLYFNIIPEDYDFVNIYNTHKILEVYRLYRQWFIKEGIFNDSHIKAFVIDAEPPKIIAEEMKKRDLIDGINYLIDKFPTEEDIKNATINLRAFTEEVRSDGKLVGIIRTRTNLDCTDGDGDIELLSNNIFSLDVEWDFAVSMLYRSQRLEKSEPGSANEFVSNILASVYGASVTKTSFVYSQYYFYLYVGIDQSISDIKAKKQYTFLGNYKSEFEKTSYIKNKEFFTDLDICRHFGEEKVFFYNYEGFIYHYGQEGIKEILEYNEQHKSWVLEYSELESQLNIMLLMFYVSIDLILFMEYTNS